MIRPIYRRCELIVHQFGTHRSLSTVAQKKITAASEDDYEKALPYEQIPGPKGMDWNFLPGGKLFSQPFVEWHRYFREKHGSLVRLPGFLRRPDFVLTYEPDDFSTVFRTEGPWPVRLGFETLAYYRNKLRPDVYSSGGLLVEHGPEWQRFRMLVNPVMIQPKTVSLYVPWIDQVTRDFIEITRRIRDANQETPADFGQYIQRWALEAIGVIALDTRLNVLEKKSGNTGDELAKLVDEFFLLTYKLDARPSLWKYFHTRNFAKLMVVLDKMTHITMEYVNDAIKKIESSTVPKPIEEQGVLEKLLKLDKQTAIIMASDMLVVGIDTTSSATKALLYLLAKNPEKQKKLRQEILEILPTKNTELTAEKMKHIPYLRACMKESNRCIPVVSGMARQTGQNLVLQGYRIPKGTHVIMATQLLMQEDNHFKRAKEFIPERWLRDDSYKAEGCPHAKETHPFIYLPFGFGSRTCIGQRFAELETATFIIRLLREFEVSWHYSDLKVKSTIVDTLDGDMKFRLKELSD